MSGRRQNGYLESTDTVVTWCVGHLITMSYPEKYDPRLKRWDLEMLPFLPEQFLYEVIGDVKPQFEIVKGLLNREDIDTIYICTDSGREGEYIYRLVDRMAGVQGKTRKRVWIDSQTEEEIQRGIREAKDWSAYDGLSAAAYLRAQEDYLMGINFSRALTLRYGGTLSAFLKRNHTVVSVGRVMTCVLGMVVRREREIRAFVKTPFYRVLAEFSKDGTSFEGEWRAVEGSAYFQSPKLYKENGFRRREDADALIRLLSQDGREAQVVKSEKKREIRNAPLLYNLAELQNDCAKRFKISPDETLKLVQELYEKKLVTYPRTDARVLSTAVAKEISRNLSGLRRLTAELPEVAGFAAEVLDGESFKKIGRTRYTNDAQITDHYAIIPTGQGFPALRSLRQLQREVYEMICRRFLAVFYPPAVYEKRSVETALGREHFFSNFRICTEEGWQRLSVFRQQAKNGEEHEDMAEGRGEDPAFRAMLAGLKKGSEYGAGNYSVKEGETSPPKRYSSGSMILAMENAGQLIEDEELRSQIRGSGIGTSATRAEILKKLVSNSYLALNGKTQIITPTLLGEMIYEAVLLSLRQLLNPELTASWEKGLGYVAEGAISPEEYMQKLRAFVSRRTEQVKQSNAGYLLRDAFEKMRSYYPPPKAVAARTYRKKRRDQ
ncbi:DNA topoisomerase-3 [Moryella indoligenes]|uniref:DNA topoisomerase n=1 Tax=Moryella indoligenes TaxID=371674 RepID=A0AAE4AM99_9FIRM|nr:DNA topoisomerase [Moryella indoligenes]MDQ0152906.1 DNA topoisomerase-3 [Moryella indoligenes]